MVTKGRRKEWHAVATRHEKTTSFFNGVPCFGAACNWLGDYREPGIRYFITKSI